MRPLATITQETIQYGIDKDGASVHDVIGSRWVMLWLSCRGQHWPWSDHIESVLENADSVVDAFSVVVLLSEC